MAYNWRTDALACYMLALRMMALKKGAVQFRTLAEMYYQEAHGVII